MKIPSVPPRREPPRVLTLDDLKRFKVARFSCNLANCVYFHELSFATGFVLSHVEYDKVFSEAKLSFRHAEVILRGSFFYAVRGASKEF